MKKYKNFVQIDKTVTIFFIKIDTYCRQKYGRKEKYYGKKGYKHL